MSLMVWIAVVFLLAMMIPVGYYGFLAIRSFVRASKEAGETIEGASRTRAIAATQQMRKPEGGGDAASKRPTEAGRPSGAAVTTDGANTGGPPSSKEAADVERALAELESKSSGKSGARMKRTPKNQTKAEDVQYRTPGTAGDPGDRTAGGGT